ncbi:unnamed protein product [Cuscuta campestris]|uniref:Uncharacterized protein n=1 Tax=Cuscuta campestris TaxID=132261 RepID=A0A484LRU4_9ASTE|nr:unnamed protein product [Cuscuta campestris]
MDRFGYSSFDDVYHGKQMLRTKPQPIDFKLNGNTLNRIHSFRIQSKIFILFQSYYNQNFCITEIGRRQYHIWFSIEDMKWLIEILPSLSKRNPWAITRYEKFRKLSILFGSNRWGNFIRIVESRVEGGGNSIFVPVINDRCIKFFSAIDSFFGKSKFDSPKVQLVTAGQKQSDKSANVHSDAVSKIFKADQRPMEDLTNHEVNSTESGFIMSNGDKNGSMVEEFPALPICCKTKLPPGPLTLEPVGLEGALDQFAIPPVSNPTTSSKDLVAASSKDDNNLNIMVQALGETFYQLWIQFLQLNIAKLAPFEDDLLSKRFFQEQFAAKEYGQSSNTKDPSVNSLSHHSSQEAQPSVEQGTIDNLAIVESLVPIQAVFPEEEGNKAGHFSAPVYHSDTEIFVKEDNIAFLPFFRDNKEFDPDPEPNRVWYPDDGIEPDDHLQRWGGPKGLTK